MTSKSRASCRLISWVRTEPPPAPGRCGSSKPRCSTRGLAGSSSDPDPGPSCSRLDSAGTAANTTAQPTQSTGRSRSTSSGAAISAASTPDRTTRVVYPGQVRRAWCTSTAATHDPGDRHHRCQPLHPADPDAAELEDKRQRDALPEDGRRPSVVAAGLEEGGHQVHQAHRETGRRRPGQQFDHPGVGRREDRLGDGHGERAHHQRHRDADPLEQDQHLADAVCPVDPSCDEPGNSTIESAAPT